MTTCVLASVALFFATSVAADVILSPAEIQQTLRHGPWPMAIGPDPSNKVSGDERSIALGEALFSDPVLSMDGQMTCATCHQTESNFVDGAPRAFGRGLLDRNTQSLWNLRVHRWFGWAGDTDNLWAQSLTPILNPKEMAHTTETLQSAIWQSHYRPEYESLFGGIEDEEPIQTSVNVSKAIASYVETLETGKTSFDVFRDALEIGDFATASNYPIEAQRGLQIFLGSGKCHFCHSGPAFTNGEFHDAGVPYFLEAGRVDPGRFAGLEALFESLFTLDGAFTDDPDKAGAWAVQNVRITHSDFGTFRVPSLRRVAQTAPYMHDGSLADLSAVMSHYNDINIERLHADGEAILAPLNVSQDDLRDLEAFLMTLSDD